MDDNTTMVLDSSKFGDFIRVLSIFKDLCDDVTIRNGVIRQKSNDNISVFEIDLTPLVGEVSIAISNLKQKLDLFKSFMGQEVTINSNNVFFKFSDNYSNLNFKNPTLEFMYNKFISEEEINRVLSMEEESLMLNTSISKMISDRIKIITGGFNVNNLVVSFNNGSSNIMTINRAKDQSAWFMQNIISECQTVCKTDISVTPFIIDHDNDINFKIYENDNNRVLSKFSTTISDINITIYCRSQLTFEQIEEGDDNNE